MKNILVPIDFSPSTPAVVRAAERLARSAGARIVLMTVAARPFVRPVPAQLSGDYVVGDQADFGRKLTEWGEKLAADGIDFEQLERFGPPVACIVEEAARSHAEFVVMGSHGHTTIHDLLIGSTVAGVLKQSPCPVLVVPIGAA